MKKIKWLLTIPAFTAPLGLVLSQCSKNSVKEGIYLDDSVADKAKMEVVVYQHKNAICTIQLDSTLIQKNKIESIKVTCNGSDLAQNEYEVNLDSGVEGQAVVTIYGNTLDYKKGRYVVIPTITAKQMTGIIVEVEPKEYIVDYTVTKNDITVYQDLEDSKGDLIPWSNDIKVYDGETLISDFITNGIKLTTYGVTKTLTIKYNTFSGLARIPVSKKQKTISVSLFSPVTCATLSENSFKADEDSEWGRVTKPIPKGKDDVYVTSLYWQWVDSDGDKIPAEKPIKDIDEAMMEISLPTKKDSKSLDFTKSTTQFSGGTAYVPQECMPSTSLQYTTLNTDIEYTFSMTVPTDETISWFWFYNGSQHRQGELMYIYQESIISIKDGDGTNIAYTIEENDNGGNYIEFTNPVAEDTTINVTFRMLRDFNGTVIPAFQHDEQ